MTYSVWQPFSNLVNPTSNEISRFAWIQDDVLILRALRWRISGWNAGGGNCGMIEESKSSWGAHEVSKIFHRFDIPASIQRADIVGTLTSPQRGIGRELA